VLGVDPGAKLSALSIQLIQHPPNDIGRLVDRPTAGQLRMPLAQAGEDLGQRVRLGGIEKKLDEPIARLSVVS
jgi:hypothetical protein